MSRLPIPGGDDDEWGNILNDFLEQSLNGDGSLKTSAVETSGAEQTANKAQPSGYASLDSGGNVPIGQLGNAPSAVDATPTSKGIVQLDGDLGGTAASPTVPTKVSKAGDTMTGKLTVPSFQVTGGAGIANQVLTSDVSGNATWVTPAASSSGPIVTFDTPEAHGAKRNGIMLSDVTITHSSNTLTSASANFSSSNVGMSVMVQHPSNGGAPLTTTVTAFTNSHNLVLAATTADLSTTNAIIGSDDTAAIAAAVSNAVSTAQAAGHTYAEVWFSEGIYVASAATTKGGATLGNSQIPLPVISSTASTKFTLAFKGIDDSSATAHWQQTVPNVTGSVICSTLQNQTNDGTWGYPSVIGGPTAAGLNGADDGFMNMHIIIDGLSLVLPFNPSQVGFDFRCLACVTIKSASIFPFDTPFNINEFGTENLNGGCVGLYMPNINNNDLCEVGSITIYGVNYGIGFADHFNAKRVAMIYCNSALLVNTGDVGTDVHGGHIDYASIEGCNVGLDASVFGGITAMYSLTIGTWDTETMISWDVDDPSNILSGEMWLGNDGTTAPEVNGAAHFRILQFNRLRGAQSSPPSVPGSTSAITNPFWRDCAVTISGGTVTAIIVDGTATGATSGTVIVPTGKTITLDYSGSPTWVWVVL